jgi:hypothetical protein
MQSNYRDRKIMGVAMAHDEPVLNDELHRLRHELSIASVFAWELREMISEALRQGHMGNTEIAERVTILDGWLEHWRMNGTLIRI